MTCATTVILVRHGQTSWNTLNKLRGRASVPLDDYGLSQASTTGRYIAKYWQPDVVYASPLRRTLQTAQQITVACKSPLSIIENSGLLDINFGEWTGVSPQDIQEKWPDEWATWRNSPQAIRFPQGESLVDASERAYTAFSTIVGQHPGETVFMVSHTATNRLIIMRILDIPLSHFWHLGQDTCAINVITCEQQACTVNQLNVTHHLVGLD